MLGPKRSQSDAGQLVPSESSSDIREIARTMEAPTDASECFREAIRRLPSDTPSLPKESTDKPKGERSRLDSVVRNIFEDARKGKEK